MKHVIPRSPRSQGLTLIELLVGVAILAVLLAVGVPSLRDWLMNQRVSAIASELVTDLQLARSESISRGRSVFVSFNSDATQTCYTVHADQDFAVQFCNCTLPPGTACAGSLTVKELKTVSVPRNTGVTLTANQNERFLPGGQFSPAVTPLSVLVSDGGSKRVVVQTAAFVQRPSACAPSGSTVSGMRPCP